MNSGLYIVTLNNLEPISVNANDPRIAHKAIKVTKANCKFGRAQDLATRRKNYFKVFGEQNVNFTPIAYVDDLKKAEKYILARLDRFRINGPTGIKNEWLENIGFDEVLEIALRTLEDHNIPYTKAWP